MQVDDVYDHKNASWRKPENSINNFLKTAANFGAIKTLIELKQICIIYHGRK